MKILCLDFETANGKHESACALGYALIDDLKIVQSGSYLIKPHKNYADFHPRNIEIHGIHAAQVADQPDFPVIFEKVRPLFKGVVIAAHNTKFDMYVLHKLLKLYKIKFSKKEFICTCGLAEKVWKRLEDYKLPTVCKHIKHELSNHHEPECDAIACAKILIEILKKNKGADIEALAHSRAVKIGMISSVEIGYREGKKLK